MPLYRRIARRGFSNYPFKVEYTILSVGTLEKSFKKGATVSMETLLEHKLIGKNDKHVKILADGEIKKSLTVEGLKVSRAAAAKIVAAGGTVAGMDADQTDAASAAPAKPQAEAVSEEQPEESTEAEATDAAGEAADDASASEKTEDSE
jgi:hypothetical protein